MSVELAVVDAREFGRLVRAGRRAKGLSQVELGGQKYSGSYISHLESGRRQATPEIIAHIVEQLGVTPAELGVEASTDVTTAADVQIAQTLLAAERAMRDTSWPHAARLAAHAAQRAEGAGRHERWWEARRVEAQALFGQGEYKRAAEIGAVLAEHDVASHSPLLKAHALVLASRAHRASGQLEDAVDYAMRALGDVNVESADQVADGLIALISALAEMGDFGEAMEAAAARLRAIRHEVSSEHGRGTIAWTLGNVALLRGQVAEGTREHDLAENLLVAEADLRLWSRLHKARATVALENGVTEGVERQIALARAGLHMVGNPSDLAELHVVEARLALLMGEQARAITLLEHCLTEAALDESPLLRGEALEVLHDCLLAAGHEQGAKNRLGEAATCYERAGSLIKAVSAWRRLAEWKNPPRRT